jgi:hypothetical protein
LYSSPNITRVIKSRRVRCEEHVARRSEKGLHIGFGYENQKERDH